jgi:hypothetical protein
LSATGFDHNFGNLPMIVERDRPVGCNLPISEVDVGKRAPGSLRAEQPGEARRPGAKREEQEFLCEVLATLKAHWLQTGCERTSSSGCRKDRHTPTRQIFLA